MTDVLAGLQKLRVDGIILPILSRRVMFQTEQARHKLQFRNDEIVEPLGSRNWMFEYTIPFREDIAKGGYKNLFTQVLPTFLATCRRAALETIDIIDPVLGRYPVTCVSAEERTDNNRRDGTDVTVQYVWVPDPKAQVPRADFSTIISDTYAFEKQNDFVIRDVRQGAREALSNPLNAIKGLIRQAGTRAAQVDAAVSNVITQVVEIEEALDDAADVRLEATRRAARNLRDKAEKYRSEIVNGPAVAIFVTDAATSIGSLAFKLGNSPSRLMELNPRFAILAPLIPKNTVVRYDVDEGPDA